MVTDYGWFTVGRAYKSLFTIVCRGKILSFAIDSGVGITRVLGKGFGGPVAYTYTI